MENIEIYRAVDAGTLDRCLEIRNRVFTLERGVPKEIEVDQYDCPDKSCDHFLFVFRKNDAGTIRCLYRESKKIQIQRFCFLKEYRGLGLGRIAIGSIEDYYKNRGIKEIELDSKYGICGFYEKCGYEKMSEVFIEANMEHIKMRKRI